MKTGRNKLIECYAGFYIWCSRNTIIIRNYYCSLLLTSQYVQGDISLRSSLKTCIAQLSTLSKPVCSCMFFKILYNFPWPVPAHVFFWNCIFCSCFPLCAVIVLQGHSLWQGPQDAQLPGLSSLLHIWQGALCGSPRKGPIALRKVLTCLLFFSNLCVWISAPTHLPWTFLGVLKWHWEVWVEVPMMVWYLNLCFY